MRRLVAVAASAFDSTLESKFRPAARVASGADLYVAKVLGDNGSGRERDIFTGIAWAIEQVWVVLCDCSLFIALIRSTAPAA